MTNETKLKLEARKSLIAKIAKRHAGDRKLFTDLEVNKNTQVESEYSSMVRDEFERVLKASTFNPISL